jgi:hypothetical protein
MAYGANTNLTQNSKPQSGGGEQSKSKQASHDLVQVDGEGEIVKEWNEDAGKELSKRIGSMWLGEKSGFIKFEDGSTCKVFPRKAKSGGGGGGGGAPAVPASPQGKTQAGTGGAPKGGSQFRAPRPN